jgi:hypothetical protein
MSDRPRTTRPEERRVRRGSERLPDEVIVDRRRRVARDRIDLVGNDLTATLRWCATHNEPVWEFNDGSYQCPYDCVTQASSEHEIVDGPWELPEGWRMTPEPLFDGNPCPHPRSKRSVSPVTHLPCCDACGATL